MYLFYLLQDDCIQLRNEGKLKLKGVKEDVLTMALNKKEHGGRVRAIGSYVTPTVYFNLPAEGNYELTNELFLAQQKELIQALTKNAEQDKRIEKLEAAVFKLGANVVDTDEKGSCSVKPDPSLNETEIRIQKKHSSERDSDNDDIIFVDTIDAFKV